MATLTNQRTDTTKSVVGGIVFGLAAAGVYKGLQKPRGVLRAA